MSETSESEQVNQSWSYYFGKTFVYAFLAVVWLLIGGVVIGDGYIETGKVSPEVGTLFMYGAFIIAGYCGIRAALYAVVTIGWPLLVALGIVGAVGVSAVQKLDEGGLKSVSDRVWYGKNGPPKK